MNDVCGRHYQTKFPTYEEAAHAAGGRGGVRIVYWKACQSWHISTRGGRRSQRRRRMGE